MFYILTTSSYLISEWSLLVLSLSPHWHTAPQPIVRRQGISTIRDSCLTYPTDIWNTLIAGSTTSTAAVRQPVNNSPVTSVTSNDIRCNVNPGAATATVSIASGSTIGFKLDNTLYHLGPASIYLGKAPSTAATWDGSGANWFKVQINYICILGGVLTHTIIYLCQIAEWGATFNPFSFSDFNAAQLTTKIPTNTPPGEVSHLKFRIFVLLNTVTNFSTWSALSKTLST